MGTGLVFRCDFGGTRGWGHVVRCSSLALEARRRGLKTCLVSQAPLEELPIEVRQAFDAYFPVRAAIPARRFWDSLVLPEGDWAWVIVDQYDYARRELNLLQQALSLAGAQVAVIDDEARRDLTAVDLVINGVLGADGSLYPKNRDVLVGADYALIRPGFQPEDARPPQEGEDLKETVVVMFGGTDARNLSGMSLRLLFDAVGEEFAPVLVRTRQIAFRDEIDREVQRFPQHLWLEGISSAELAAQFRRARFAITACGGSIYEAAFCGVPFIGVVVAPNQERLGKAIVEAWDFPVVRAEELSRRGLKEAFAKIRERANALPPQGRGPLPGVDGQGARRVIDAIVERTPEGV